MYFAFQISVRLGDGGPGQTPREWLQNARKPAFQPPREFFTLPQNLATARKGGHTAILWGFDGALRVRAGVGGGDGHGFLAVLLVLHALFVRLAGGLGACSGGAV